MKIFIFHSRFFFLWGRCDFYFIFHIITHCSCDVETLHTIPLYILSTTLVSPLYFSFILGDSTGEAYMHTFSVNLIHTFTIQVYFFHIPSTLTCLALVDNTRLLSNTTMIDILILTRIAVELKY